MLRDERANGLYMGGWRMLAAFLSVREYESGPSRICGHVVFVCQFGHGKYARLVFTTMPFVFVSSGTGKHARFAHYDHVICVCLFGYVGKRI